MAKVADGPTYCDAADVVWKPHALADLAELLPRAAKHDELVLWAAEEDEAISKGIAAATTRANCKAIEQRIDRFFRRVLALDARSALRVAKNAPPVDQSCQPDDRWKSNSRLTLSELRDRAAANSRKFDLFEERKPEISRGIARAITASQCARVEASLQKLLQELNE